MQLNLLTRLATASGILILGQQWIPNLLKYKINREGKYCLWHVRNFLIYLNDKTKKSKKKKPNKQTNKNKKTHKQKTNMELASNLLHVHVTPKIRPNMPLCHI